MFSLLKFLPLLVLSCVSAYATTFADLSSRYLNNDQLIDKVQVIDCRSSNQYNGWPLKDDPSEGHFPGAKNIDTDWLKLLNEKELEQLINEKHLQKSKPTFVYCAKEDSKKLSQKLKK